MRKFVIAAVALTGLSFAFIGGEYSTPNWWEIRQMVRAEEASILQLQLEVDSLGDLANRLETDPVTQERIAREWFGMLREGETIVRIVRP